MTCGHCKASVEEEVGALPGVETVDADVEAAVVTVSGDVDRSAVVEVITGIGYSVTDTA